MDNSESWRALLRALDSMPPSTSSEISFPCKTKASGDQECVINFSMNPLSDEWKKTHVERSPNIEVFENLATLPTMGEDEVTLGEKRTFVVGNEGGWRAINTVVELAGIELEGDEADSCEGSQVEQEDGATLEDTVMETTDDNDNGSGPDDLGSRSGKGKRNADSQDSAEDKTCEHETERATSQPDDVPHTQEAPANEPSYIKSTPEPRRPKKKRRKITNSKIETPTPPPSNESTTSTTPTPSQDSAHLVEIARLCELMSKPTPKSPPAPTKNPFSPNHPSTIPKVRLVRRKANKLQCKRCLDLGTSCDTQTPCSPCRRLGRGMSICRPCEEERDAVRRFAFGKMGEGEKVERERKELFFDRRGRFCKKEEAFRCVGEDGVSRILEKGEGEKEGQEEGGNEEENA